MTLLGSCLLIASVGAIGICAVFVIEDGVWSCARSIWYFYRWIFLGKPPDCPKCHGTGRRFPVSDRSVIFGLGLLMLLVIGGLFLVGQIFAVTH